MTKKTEFSYMSATGVEVNVVVVRQQGNYEVTINADGDMLTSSEYRDTFDILVSVDKINLKNQRARILPHPKTNEEGLMLNYKKVFVTVPANILTEIKAATAEILERNDMDVLDYDDRCVLDYSGEEFLDLRGKRLHIEK